MKPMQAETFVKDTGQFDNSEIQRLTKSSFNGLIGTR